MTLKCRYRDRPNESHCYISLVLPFTSTDSFITGITFIFDSTSRFAHRRLFRLSGYPVIWFLDFWQQCRQYSLMFFFGLVTTSIASSVPPLFLRAKNLSHTHICFGDTSFPFLPKRNEGYALLNVTTLDRRPPTAMTIPSDIPSPNLLSCFLCRETEQTTDQKKL